MTDFEKYIQRYLDLIPTEDWLDELKIVGKETLNIYENLFEDQSNYAYAEGKWSLKTLLQHLIDTEKVFAYRYQGTRYDCGSKLGFLEATVDLALGHPEVGAHFSEWLATKSFS